MADEPSGIPLAEVFRAANELVAVGLIEDYALGGRSPLSTTSSPSPHTMSTSSFYLQRRDSRLGFPRSTRICRIAAGASNTSTCSCKGSQFNFWPHRDSRKRRFAKRARSNTKAFPQRCFVPIAASVGRYKDFARIAQLLEQVEIDRTLLDDILARYKLRLPKP